MKGKEPDLNHVSAFDAWLDSIVEETKTFVVRLSDGRPPLVFRKTRNWDDLNAIKERVKKAILSVTDNAYPPAWKPFLASDITPVGQSVWMADRHVGYLEWRDCDEPAEAGPQFRKLGEQWQEEVLVPISSSEFAFLKMSAKDPHGFQSLSQAFFDNVGVGWSASDANHFREAA